ncbi:uncharacterized protein LOC134786815 [Penaeus indicus]|uniref:uncharacterized protein LOC134786815 n=1 Tax=Penaeus indicus TaxID=29960 RepID=UPI00300DA151
MLSWSANLGNFRQNLTQTGEISQRRDFRREGQELHERRLYGVGFAVRNSLLSTIESPSSGTLRVLSLRLTTSSGPANFLSVYAPTLCSTAEAKDQFYEELEAKIRQIPAKEHLFLLGDFNARVGADHDPWPRCIGHFGVGNINENGQRLLELCSFHELCLTNTFFATKLHHRVSWRHPRSRHWHQLDFVITRRTLLNHVLVTRSYHSANCDIDHSLVVRKVRLLPRRLYHSKQKPRPRINTFRINNPELREHFARAIDVALEGCPTGSATERWNHIRKAVFQTFGKRERKSADWFEPGVAELEPTIAAKRAALLPHKNDPSTKTLAALRAARSNTHRIARRCANNYWSSLCQDIQLFADMVNVWGMYESLKKAFGPSTIKTGPIKSAKGVLIKGRSKQMKRWAKHFQELYSRETTVSNTALERTHPLLTMGELDAPPTIEELRKEAVAGEMLGAETAPDMSGTVQFDGSCSEPFPIRNGVKQGCVLAPTLFGIFFSLLLSHAFGDSDDGIFIHTRSDGGLFNLARLQAKTKVRKVFIRELLFADDAALATHTEAGLQ